MDRAWINLGKLFSGAVLLWIEGMHPNYGELVRRHVFIPRALYAEHRDFFDTDITLHTADGSFSVHASYEPLYDPRSIARIIENSRRDGSDYEDTVLGSLHEDYEEEYEKIMTEEALQDIEELNRKIEGSIHSIERKLQITFSVDGSRNTCLL